MAKHFFVFRQLRFILVNILDIAVTVLSTFTNEFQSLHHLEHVNCHSSRWYRAGPGPQAMSHRSWTDRTA